MECPLGDVPFRDTGKSEQKPGITPRRNGFSRVPVPLKVKPPRSKSGANSSFPTINWRLMNFGFGKDPTTRPVASEVGPCLSEMLGDRSLLGRDERCATSPGDIRRRSAVGSRHAVLSGSGL
jgi:hypothetical protein